MLCDYPKNSLSESDMLCLDQLKIQNIKVYEIKTGALGSGSAQQIKHLTYKREAQSAPAPSYMTSGHVYTLVTSVLNSQRPGILEPVD